MNHFRLRVGILVLTAASLACNLGTPAGAPTATLDATAQADAILATGYAQLTASAPVQTASPSETSTPLVVIQPTDTSVPSPTNTSIPSATNTSAPQIPEWPLFRQGDQGPEVRAIQHLLRFKGQNVDVDGIFGGQTRAAVIAFQNQTGLAADGIVGPLTWSALIQGALIQEGSTGQAVRAAQTLLRNKFGYGINVDGIFGPQTENATRDFQTDYSLLVDGIVGPQTWQALVSIEP